MVILDLRDDLIVHAVGRAQTEFLVRLVEHVDHAASVPESCVALATIVVSTVSRSMVELTAWLTSPSARSSSTDWASSAVRCLT